MSAWTGKRVLGLAIGILFLSGCIYVEPPIREPHHEEDSDSYDEEPCEDSEDNTWRCNGDIREFCSQGYWLFGEDCSDSGEDCTVQPDGSWAQCE